MLTDKEKAIALECIEKVDSEGWDFGVHRELVQFADLFLSRIREKQEAVAWLSEEGWPYKVKQRDDAGFGDYYPNQKPLFTTPPAAPDCSELVEALKLWESAEKYGQQYNHLPDAREEIATAWDDAAEARDKVLANHAKRMKGEE